MWIVQGQTVNYDLEISNDGNLPSGAFSIVDTLPAGLSFVSATGSGFVCSNNTPTAGQLQCDYTPPTATQLYPLQSVNIDLALKVSDLAQAPFVNHAEIVSDSSGDYGLTDADSTPNTNSAVDSGPGEDPAGELEDDSGSATARSASTTPITLKLFRSKLINAELSIDWVTSMENGNQGFRLYGRETGGQWYPIKRAMIPTRAVGDNGTTYRYTFSLTRPIDELSLTDYRFIRV